MISFLQTIGFRLWLVAAFVIAVPLIINIGIMEYGQYKAVLRVTKNQLKKDSLLKTRLIEEIPPLNRSVVDFLVAALDLDTNFPQTPDNQLSRKLRTFFRDGFEEITLILPLSQEENLVVASSEILNEGRNYSSKLSLHADIPLYISLKKSESSPHKILFVTEANIYHPETGIPIGILYATHEASSLLNPILQNSLPIHNLIFSDQELIAASDNTLMHESALQNLFLPILNKQPNHNEFINFTINKEKSMGYLAEIPDLNLNLINYQNYEIIFVNLKKTIFFALLSLSLFIPILILTFALIKRLSLPMIHLAQVMSATGKNFSKIAEYQKDRLGFEINRLGEIFNNMVKTVLLKRFLAETAEKEKNESLAELELGRKAQEALLNMADSDFPNLEISKIYIPALSVGGDFYDLFMSKDNQDLSIIIADASDKGVSACCYSLELKMILETLLLNTSSLEMAILQTARLFHKDTKETGMFVTAFIARYHYAKHLLSYFSCGHVPAILLNNHQEITVLKHPGMAFGFMDHVSASHCHQIPFKTGDKLILYSDGITEACNSADQLFGEERFIETIRQTQNMSTQETVEHILNRIHDFVGNEPQNDDITLMVIKVKR